MTPCLRVLYIIGAALTIVGSFLPWQREGDFVSYWTCGICLRPYFKDNGGLLIVFLSAAVLSLVLLSPRLAERSTIWSIVFGVVLVLASGYHIARWLVRRIEANGVIGAPALQIGLVIALLGSSLLLATALLHHSKRWRSE
jgi:hypothetical protein